MPELFFNFYDELEKYAITKKQIFMKEKEPKVKPQKVQMPKTLKMKVKTYHPGFRGFRRSFI